MRRGHHPTSDKNELSSSGTFTGATSKNLNCHFSRVSVAMSEVRVPARAYRSDCHTAATVPCSLLPQSQLLYRDQEELGASTRDEPRASAQSRLAYRAMTAASVLTYFCALLSSFLHHSNRPLQPYFRAPLSTALFSSRSSFYTCATLLTTPCHESRLLIRAAAQDQRAPLSHAPRPVRQLSNHHTF
jgi:hypothetical protein